MANYKQTKSSMQLRIFDYIHSLDSEKLAKKIAEEQKKHLKKKFYSDQSRT